MIYESLLVAGQVIYSVFSLSFLLGGLNDKHWRCKGAWKQWECGVYVIEVNE